MQNITPCLWFDGQAEEAATYYCSIFPSSRVIEVARCGPAGPGPEGSALLVRFELNGHEFTALNGGPEFTFNEAVSFQVSVADQEEFDFYWERLAEGGGHLDCGWLKDRYGLAWQIVPSRLIELLNDSDAGRAERAMRSMMTMQRIDIAAIESAAAS